MSVSISQLLLGIFWGTFYTGSVACAGSSTNILALNGTNAEQMQVRFDKYVRAKHDEMGDVAKKLEIHIPPSFEDLFSVLITPPSPAVTNAYLMAEKEESNLLWTAVHQTAWASSCLSHWNPRLANLYIQDMHAALGDKGLLLSGTDAGYFLVPVLTEPSVNGPLPIISLNKLTSEAYCAYVRETMRRRIAFPEETEITREFAIVSNIVEVGHFCPDARAKAQLLNCVNSRIARLIVVQNANQYVVNIDQGYGMPLLYPYLSPNGILMRVHQNALNALNKDDINRDFEYWANREKTLFAMNEFENCVAARRAYSQLRSAIGGLYVYWELYDEAENALKQSLRLYPSCVDANGQLIHLYLVQDKFNEAEGQLAKYIVNGATLSERNRYEGVIKNQKRMAARQYILENKRVSTNMLWNESVELAEIYEARGMDKAFNKAILGAISPLNLTHAQFDSLAEICARGDHLDVLADALEFRSHEIKHSSAVDMALALVCVYLGDYSRATQVIGHGATLFGDPFMKDVLSDKEFAPLRKNEEFKELLIPPKQ